MHGMHSLLFSRRNSLSKAFGWAVRQPMWATRAGAHVLHTLERNVKRPWWLRHLRPLPPGRHLVYLPGNLP